MTRFEAPAAVPQTEAFAAAVHGSHVPMLLTDPHLHDNPIVFANDAFCALTGYPREELVGRNCRLLQGPDTKPDHVAALRQAIAEAKPISLELLNYRKDGRPFWNLLQISPVFDAAGGLSHFFSIQCDLSGQHRAQEDLLSAKEGLEAAVAARTQALSAALEQSRILLHELDHRVKNNLQMISSLALLQARRTQDPAVRDALNEMQERLNAIGIVHRGLFQSDDASELDISGFIRELVQDLAGACPSAAKADVELEPMRVPAGQAAALALLFNEILTGVLRPGGEAVEGGALFVKNAKSGDRFRIEIANRGVSRREQSGQTAGFGHMIVELLCRQTQAQIERPGAETGVDVAVVLPRYGG